MLKILTERILHILQPNPTENVELFVEEVYKLITTVAGYFRYKAVWKWRTRVDGRALCHGRALCIHSHFKIEKGPMHFHHFELSVCPGHGTPRVWVILYKKYFHEQINHLSHETYQVVGLGWLILILCLKCWTAGQGPRTILRKYFPPSYGLKWNLVYK